MKQGHVFKNGQSFRRFCEACATWFTAGAQNAKHCPVCKAAKGANAACGKKYTLVKCDHERCEDFANLGMIDCNNSLTIWRTLDVRGGIFRNGSDYLRWDGEDFIPCQAPHPPISQPIARMDRPPRFVEAV